MKNLVNFKKISPFFLFISFNRLSQEIPGISQKKQQLVDGRPYIIPGGERHTY
jgi:hypothetical protein